MNILRATHFLCIIVFLVTAGCSIAEKHPSTENKTTRIMFSPTNTQISPVPYERITKKVIPQPHPRADYFRMLKDIWDQGDEISVTFVNDGTGTISCRNWEPDFYVYHLLGNGSSIRVRGGMKPVQPAVRELRQGEIFHYRISTGDLDPGRYSLLIDCGGGIYREFLIQPSKSVNVTATGS